MEQVSGLYNPDFVGGQFSWWLGQVANSRSWRDNQPRKHFLFRNDIPGWGYRYKVRIMGIHDSGCATIPSDELPWAQVMYPITAGGGQGGDFESPGIKQGNIVFGFFLDGVDEQVPIIMGVLGNNSKTIIKNLNDAENCEFEPKSGYDTETTKASDDQLMTKDVASVPTIESTDANNKDNAADENQKIEREKESPIECPKHGNTLTSMQTHMGNFQKDYQRLMDQLNSYGSAASVKTAVDTDEVNSKIDQLIEKTSKLSAKSLTPSVNNTQNFLSEKLNETTRNIDKLANITDRLDNLEANVAAQGKLGCVFNKIKGDLARLIAAGIKNSLAKKQNRTPQRANQTRPQGNNSGLIPPIPPEDFYTPMNPCETEDIIADVFSNVMGDITQGYQDAITPLAAGSGTSTQGRLASVLSQENVVTNLENGKLFGGLASALGAGLGIGAGQSGAITSALKSGNYAAALTSLVDFSGSSTAIGGLSTAIQSIDNGDIVGAFQGLSGPLGIDSKLMGAVGGALGAIKGGDMGSLTNALGNLGGVAPNILTDVLGGRLPLSGIDVGGFGALGGLDFDLALATTFMSTAAAFLECDPPDECPVNDTHTLGGGGVSKDESKSQKVNKDNIIDKVKATNIPSGDALKAGSFGISPEGATQALNNRLESQTGIPANLEAGSFSISEAGAREALTNRIESQTGIPANLPEGAFTVTPKKKFNVPTKETFTVVDDPFVTTLTESTENLSGGGVRQTTEIKTTAKGNTIERQRKIYEEELETWTKSFNRTKSLAMKERTLNLINDARQKLGTFTGDYRFYQSHFLLPPELRNDKNLQLSDVPFMN